MTSLIDALQWSGKPVVSVFAAFPAGTAPELDLADIESVISVRRYRLEDDRDRLRGVELYEYDVELVNLPDDLKGQLEELLRRASRCGARVAWLGLEGSFDFEHVLTPDVADQIYGVCIDAGEPAVAVNEEARRDSAWMAHVNAARDAVL